LAPPPVFREGAQKLPPQVSKSIDIYIFGQDCIPRVSLASAARLLAALRAVDALKLTAKESLLFLAADMEKEESLEEETKRILQSVTKAMEAPQERFPFLDHPGRVHYLYRREEDGEKVKRLKKKRFNYKLRCSILPQNFLDVLSEDAWYLVAAAPSAQHFSRQLAVLDRMVLDHLEKSYRKAFQRVLIGSKPPAN